MNTVNSNEAPSIRRLQARAAKSAIRRVNEIYNSTLAQATLDHIVDPTERSEKAFSLRQEAEMEVNRLADRLANLIPTDNLFDVSSSDLKIEQYNSGNYIQSSTHLYTLPSLQTESPALQKLFDEFIVRNYNKSATYDIDYLNPMGIRDLSSDDEFIAEWYKKHPTSRLRNIESIDDEENTMETVLV
jgi:hypothetical protein